MRVASMAAVVMLSACGGKDGYIPDTSPVQTSVTGCPYTDLGVPFDEHKNSQDCTQCPADWECQTYDNLNTTKCFLPCKNQEECDECAPSSTCETTEIGAENRPVRICRD